MGKINYFDDENLNMIFLLAKDIEISGVGIVKAKSIDDISDIGMGSYNQFISLLTIDSHTIYEMLGMEDVFLNVHPFDFISQNAFSNDDFKNNVIDALTFFTGGLVELEGLGNFTISYLDSGKNGIVQKSNFNFFVDILKRQNCISDKSADKDRPKPKNEAQRKFYEKLNKEKSKRKKDEGDLSDIISSVCAKHPSINLLNIGNLTIYQLVDQYKRLNMIDEYYISIKSLLAGCTEGSNKIKHWASPIVEKI